MTITEFDCLDVYYEWWKHGFKGRLVICKECGELILSKSKTCPNKRCEKCAKQLEREYDRKRKSGK